MKAVETVTGRIPVDRLGKTLIYEHFIFGYPGFQGNVTLGTFNKEEALERHCHSEAVSKHGVQTVVYPSPNECSRDSLFLRQISDATSLQIICATGFYYEGEGATPYFKLRQGGAGNSGRGYRSNVYN
ncbi:hypothetical protein [Neobacillus cucumis]|uniref:phosphotriesterase family protein n=1 Tax=Neobacillus cucumis TaxID=1740721 RepID=UPI0027E31FEB|nr:hypothetical protein [Neobacillus cucumis]